MADADKKRVVIAGGSGFLGLNLARHLSSDGYEVVILSRRAPAEDGPWTHLKWDARSLGEWASSLDGAEAIVNLAGRTVDCMKTPDNCDEILRSRVESTRVLGEALREVSKQPRVWVQMSTAHIYGDPPTLMCDENSAQSYGLAPTVGRAWEEAFESAIPEGMRGVVLRTSFVLGRSGGAMLTLSKLAKFGLGGKVGHGRQGMSWIHEADMNRIMQWAIESDSAQGVYIATAPNPVSNAEFMRELRRVVKGVPLGLPAPAWLVRIGAPLVMRTDPELALYGRYCRSIRLEEDGFEFEHPELAAALVDLYKA